MRTALVTLSTLFLLVGTACAKQQLAVSMDDQPSGEAGHFVLIVTKRDNMRVYDCLSRPDGSAWNPTCVRADLKGEAGGTVR